MSLKPGLAQLQIHFPTILGRIRHHQALRDTLVIVSHCAKSQDHMTNPIVVANPVPYGTSASSYSYISTPSSSSSDLYPTSTVWPYSQGINPVASPAYASSYTPWQTQSPFQPAGSQTATPQRTDPINIVQPYAQQNQTASTGNPQGAAGSLGSLEGLGFDLGLRLSDMQDYPSPGSSNSAQTASSYAPVLPSNVMSPVVSSMQSPSLAGDTVSRQSSRRSREPPRNAEGLLYCDHTEHAQQQAPVFSRKCEWR